MDRELEKNMCKLPDASINSDVTDWKERTERYINPALRYACLSWHTHLVDEDMIRAHAPTISGTNRGKAVYTFYGRFCTLKTELNCAILPHP
jgi:hypothetical protein